MIVFITETNNGTTVKRVPQEQMFDKSYTLREQCSSLFRVVMLMSFRDVLNS